MNLILLSLGPGVCFLEPGNNPVIDDQSIIYSIRHLWCLEMLNDGRFQNG